MSGKVARPCNRILKDYLVQSANHLGLHGPEEFMIDFRRREVAGQHAAFGIARRYLRMARGLMKHQCAYLPSALRGGSLEKSQGAAYYLQLWPGLAQKWRRAGALEAALEPSRAMGQWRAAVEAIYEIKLPL